MQRPAPQSFQWPGGARNSGACGPRGQKGHWAERTRGTRLGVDMHEQVDKRVQKRRHVETVQIKVHSYVNFLSRFMDHDDNLI